MRVMAHPLLPSIAGVALAMRITARRLIEDAGSYDDLEVGAAELVETCETWLGRLARAVVEDQELLDPLHGLEAELRGKLGQGWYDEHAVTAQLLHHLVEIVCKDEVTVFDITG